MKKLHMYIYNKIYILIKLNNNAKILSDLSDKQKKIYIKNL